MDRRGIQVRRGCTNLPPTSLRRLRARRGVWSTSAPVRLRRYYKTAHRVIREGVFGDWAGCPANSMAGATGWSRRWPTTRIGRRHGPTTRFGTTRAGAPDQRDRKAADLAGLTTGAAAWCALRICSTCGVPLRGNPEPGDCGPEPTWAATAHRERELEGKCRRRVGYQLQLPERRDKAAAMVSGWARPPGRPAGLGSRCSSRSMGGGRTT